MLVQIIERRKSPLPPHALFLPLITKSSWTPLLELDYNLHKSNSTYFSDLDVSRAQIMICLLRTGIERLMKGEEVAMVEETVKSGSVARYGVEQHAETARQGGGRFIIALGGISCHFKKEIKVYSGYEIWTRVLSWDRKWIYLVSHIVKRGMAKPREYVLQPGKWRGGGPEIRRNKESEEVRAKRKEQWKKGIYATSIAKYVVKRGRITVPPELVLERSRLLPPRPSERKENSISIPTLEGDGITEQSMISIDTRNPARDSLEASAILVNGTKTPSNESTTSTKDSGTLLNEEHWDWDACEKKRLEGLKYAEMFAGLDQLHDEFNGDLDGALGSYTDLFW
ncbi:MAG: hypothetical protein M1822_010152 [Bathelium mastoideum]|nr:MAG: hypothetical protein M1822_010152 [Bathelium mastoideum]